MSQGIGGVGGSGSVSGVGSLGTCTSVNFIFAKLQMELAVSARIRPSATSSRSRVRRPNEGSS
ncbi:MAG: hypothetical protein ACLRWP_14280 [Bilophila wadsworthia]